jgi:iron complex outermembrane receptor protein
MFKSKNNMTAMSGKRFKKSLLAVSIVALSVPTFAQDNKPADENLEEVVVTGMRSSIDTAQELKRNADTVKDVITATDIGALPDKSVTEALQRVPGVTIERFASSDDPKHYADEGTGVLVRGLDRVRSEINGRDAFSANPWGGLSYEDFPAELLGAVEVVKNQTADLISGGIAGTVNLVTRKPFDSDERMISFNAKANYGDFREEVTPSFSGLFADRWDTSAGEFGILLAGSQSEYETRGDGVGLGNFHARGTDNTPSASWDIWGTPVGPGKVEGAYDSICTPKTIAWMGDCGGVAGNLITADQAYRSPFDGSALPGQPDGATWYTPANYHMSTAENDRERTGFTTSLQWQNTDETVVATLEHINSKASLEWRERVIASGDRGFVTGSGNAVTWSDDAANGHPITVDGNGFLTTGVGKNTSADFALHLRSRWNYNENTVEDTSFNVKLRPSDSLTVDLDYQHVDSEQIVHNYSMSSRVNGGVTADVAPFFLDLRGSVPKIEYLSDRISNPTLAGGPDMFLGTGMEQESYSEAKMDSFKIDVEYEMDGLWTAIKSGVYYSDKELAVSDTEYANWVAIGTPWIAGDRTNASTVNVPDIFERVSFDDYYRGKVIQGANNSFLFPKMELVKNFADTLRQGCIDGWVGKGDVAGNANDGSGGCAKPYADLKGREGRDGLYLPHNMSSSNEKRTEFYVRGDFEFADLAVPVKGNLGARYVNYQLESTGFLVLPPTSSRSTGSTAAVMQAKYPEIYALAAGTATQSTVDGTDYDTILPSLNLTFGLSDDVIVRFGASKGLYYPSLLDSRNSLLVNLDYTKVLQDPSRPQEDTGANPNPVVDLKDIEISAVARNAYLEPEESTNLDLTAEWYFAKAGSVTFGLFHKELDNIIRNESFSTQVTYSGATYPISAYGPANTGSGTIRGAEFSYSQFYDFLPGAWSGLGLQLNYTYIDQNGLEDPNQARADLQFSAGGTPISDNRNSFRMFSGLPLQGYSDENLNVVGMYEYNDFSFRLAYTWRSDYLLTLRESEEFVPAYTKASGMVDASLYYTINDTWKVGVEGSNLLRTDTETQYQLNQQGDKTDALSFTTDRRFALSVRANF